MATTSSSSGAGDTEIRGVGSVMAATLAAGRAPPNFEAPVRVTDLRLYGSDGSRSKMVGRRRIESIVVGADSFTTTGSDPEKGWCT
jgi:hypothetical protein